MGQHKHAEHESDSAPIKERRRYNSLRVALIYFVFTLMVLSGVITGSIIIILNALFGLLHFFGIGNVFIFRFIIGISHFILVPFDNGLGP